MSVSARLSWAILTMFLAGFLVVAHTLLASQASPSVRRTHADLLSLVDSFHSYQKDFLEMANSRKGDPEFELLIDLHKTARSVEDRLSADYTMVSIFDDLQCPEDRARVRHYISEHFGYNSKSLDFDLAGVNNVLAYSKIAAAAQLGLQMRNTLRTSKEKLNSIVDSLE